MNETSMPSAMSDEDLPYDPVDDPREPMPAPAILVYSKNRRSACIGKIAAALAKAQGAMKGAAKDSANPFFKSKYADLASVWEDCRGPLSANEIAVFQMPSTAGKRVTVTTLLAHPSDQWLENELEMESKDASPQGIGSAITYARRYALASMAGVYQTDDDAEAAHGRATQSNGHPARQPAELDGQELTNEKREMYLPEIAKAIDAEDSMGLRQLVDELSQREWGQLFKYLNSKQKEKSRALLQKKAAA